LTTDFKSYCKKTSLLLRGNEVVQDMTHTHTKHDSRDPEVAVIM